MSSHRPGAVMFVDSDAEVHRQKDELLSSRCLAGGPGLCGLEKVVDG